MFNSCYTMLSPLDGDPSSLTPTTSHSKGSAILSHPPSPAKQEVVLVNPTDGVLKGTLKPTSTFRTVPVTCVEGSTVPSPTKSLATRFSKLSHCFFNSKKHNHSLRLSDSDYNRLLQGNSVEFFHKKDLHHMVVRLHRPAPSTCSSDFVQDVKEFVSNTIENAEGPLHLNEIKNLGFDRRGQDSKKWDVLLLLGSEDPGSISMKSRQVSTTWRKRGGYDKHIHHKKLWLHNHIKRHIKQHKGPCISSKCKMHTSGDLDRRPITRPMPSEDA